VAHVRTEVSEEYIASIYMVTRIGVIRFLVTANIIHTCPILVAIIMEEIRSSETRVLT
jgi:hypothetical protein